MIKWKMMPTHWGEGQIYRECDKSDPAWEKTTINGKPHVQYKTDTRLTFEQADQLVAELNSKISDKHV